MASSSDKYSFQHCHPEEDLDWYHDSRRYNFSGTPHENSSCVWQQIEINTIDRPKVSCFRN